MRTSALVEFVENSLISSALAKEEYFLRSTLTEGFEYQSTVLLLL